MKIAICLYGYSGSPDKSKIKENLYDPLICFKNYREKIFDLYNCDIFIHTWKTNLSDRIKEIYNPKDIIIEDQPIFNFPLDKYRLSFLNDYIGIIKSYDKPTETLKDLISRTHSRWMSTCKSLKLMSDYSKLKKIKYDFVFQLRFDLFFYKSINFKTLNQNTFYHPIRKHEIDIAINDHFFISNQLNAEKFALIYEQIFELSIRPVCAAKYFLEKNNIYHAPIFELGKDFQLLRHLNFNQNEKVSKLQKLLNKIKI